MKAVLYGTSFKTTSVHLLSHGEKPRAMTVPNDKNRKDKNLCLAKTRSGGLCLKHPIVGRVRCRLHGGLSTGPRTPEGKAACVAAHWKHGKRSKAFVEARKQIWAELRRVEKEMRAKKYI